MKNQDINATPLVEQIAREAAEKIHWHHVKKPDAYGQEEAARSAVIIQAAIEKGYTTGYEHGAQDQRAGDTAAQPQRNDKIICPNCTMSIEPKSAVSGAASGEHCPDCKQKLTGDDMLDREVHGRCNAASVPPTACSPGRVAGSEPPKEERGEPQEWTVNYHELISPSGHSYFIEDDHQTGEHPAKRLKDAINAALAAEREKSELKLATTISKEESELFSINRDLFANNRKLQQQLLQALAAIEKHNERARKGRFSTIHVDLSLLEQHDAEVRKSLVEALKFFKSVIQSGESWTPTCQRDFDAALALATASPSDGGQAKEGK